MVQNLAPPESEIVVHTILRIEHILLFACLEQINVAHAPCLLYTNIMNLDIEVVVDT